MRKPVTTSTRLGRALTSVRRAHNQLERLLTHANTLRDAAQLRLWIEERRLHDQACELAGYLRQVIDDEHEAAKPKRRAA